MQFPIYMIVVCFAFFMGYNTHKPTVIELRDCQGAPLASLPAR